MNWDILKRRSSLNLIGAIILLIGLAGAALIYQSAKNDLYGEAAEGSIYLTRPENFKLYRHNLEVYGGKFNVIMDDFWRWFTGLGQGKSLAFIIACLAIIISCGFFYKANYWSQPSTSNLHPENDPDGTG